MVLLATAQGAISQPFGPSHLQVEPTMYANSEKAYWLPVAGVALRQYLDFHPGIDKPGALGSPIHAMEDGHVVWAAFQDSINGKKVEVQINSIARYSSQHLSEILVRPGQRVTKGQTIARMGATGVAFGVHDHNAVSMYEPGPDGIHRTWLYNPELFMAGGKYANDKRIQPEIRHVRLNGLGSNIRLAPAHQPIGEVFARSMDPAGPAQAGIYRRGTGNRLAGLGYTFTFIYWRRTPHQGTWAIVRGFNRRLAIRDEFIHFVD